MRNKTKKITLITGLQLFIAAFFVLGAERASHSLYILYQSYFADIFLPFGFYFLLSLLENQHSFFRKWWIKGLSVFFLCATSEVLQYFGVFALARVFDPIDFIMYGVGIGLAVIVDRHIFFKYYNFWKHN